MGFIGLYAVPCPASIADDLMQAMFLMCLRQAEARVNVREGKRSSWNTYDDLSTMYF